MESLYNLHRILAYTSALPNHKPENVRAHTGCLTMRAVLHLKTNPANTIVFSANKPSRFVGKTRVVMADGAPNKAAEAINGKDKGSAETKKSEPPPPPPPEKPLPGDCCGSGCVRCVWDLYYEELEEYDKLCKTDSNPNSKTS